MHLLTIQRTIKGCKNITNCIVSERAGFERPTIVLCEAGDDHLRVALGPQGAALQQGLAKVDAAGVHVQARIHVVQCIHDDVQIGPEGVVKDVLSVRGDPILQRAHLQRRVDGLGGSRRDCGLRAAAESLALLPELWHHKA